MKLTLTSPVYLVLFDNFETGSGEMPTSMHGVYDHIMEHYNPFQIGVSRAAVCEPTFVLEMTPEGAWRDVSEDAAKFWATKIISDGVDMEAEMNTLPAFVSKHLTRTEFMELAV